MKPTIVLFLQIKTNKWRGYSPLAKDFKNLVQVDSGKKGGNFPALHRCIMGIQKAGSGECTFRLKNFRLILMNTVIGLTVAL